MNAKETKEYFSVNGEKIIAKIKEVIKQGNAHRIIIENQRGKVLLEIPIYVGAVGVACAPVMSAIGTLAALVGRCRIVVIKKDAAVQKP